MPGRRGDGAAEGAVDASPRSLKGVRSAAEAEKVSKDPTCSHGLPRGECEADWKHEGKAFATRFLEGMLERDFQRSVKKVLEDMGFVVWTFPQMKMTVAGVPDLTFWHPQRPGRLYCWELKTEHGPIRPAQKVALAHLQTVAGIDARIVRPSQWEELRDALITGKIAT